MHHLTFVFTDAGGYGFTAPDVDGFTAHAETGDFAEAVATACHVFTAHLSALIVAGGTLPRARSLAELRADPELAEDFAGADPTVQAISDAQAEATPGRTRSASSYRTTILWPGRSRISSTTGATLPV